MRPNKSNKVTSGMCWTRLAIGKYLSAASNFDIIMGVSAMPTIWSGPQNWWTYLHADLITKATSNTVLPEEHMCWAMNCTSGSPFQSTLFMSQSALCVTAGQATHAHGLVRRRDMQRVVRGKVQQSKTRSHILGNGFFLLEDLVNMVQRWGNLGFMVPTRFLQSLDCLHFTFNPWVRPACLQTPLVQLNLSGDSRLDFLRLLWICCSGATLAFSGGVAIKCIDASPENKPQVEKQPIK